MNMFARFDENPAMTLRVIKETKRYGRTDARTDGRTDARTDNVKTVYPLQTKFAGGIITGSYPNPDLININACNINMVKFCPFFLKLLNGNEILTSIKGHNSLTNL